MRKMKGFDINVFVLNSLSSEQSNEISKKIYSILENTNLKRGRYILEALHNQRKHLGIQRICIYRKKKKREIFVECQDS